MNTSKRRTNWWRGIKAIIREYPNYINRADKLSCAEKADFEAVEKAISINRDTKKNYRMRGEIG